MSSRAEYFRNRHQENKKDPAYIERRRRTALEWHKKKKADEWCHKWFDLIFGYKHIEREDLGL